MGLDRLLLLVAAFFMIFGAGIGSADLVVVSFFAIVAALSIGVLRG